MTDLATYGDRVAAIHRQYPMLGIARDIHRTDRGGPILFAERPYLAALYMRLPTMREAVFRKAVQTGVSEALIQLMLYRAGWRGALTTYGLPTNPVAYRFVAGRINPLVESIPAYRSRLPHGTSEDRKPDIGSSVLKRFGSGNLRFVGMDTRNNLVEYSTDLFVIDEVDLAPPAHVAMAKDRLSASSDPQLIYVGNPTEAGKGIDALYAAGDRSKWRVRCGCCNKLQALDWFLHFIEQTDDGRWVPRDRKRAQDPAWGDLRPVCVKCGRAFDRTPERAQWVAERTAPGLAESFTNSHMDILSTVPGAQPMRAMYAEWILAQTEDAKLVRFFQSKLGLARRPEGAAMTVEMLRGAATGPAMDTTGASVSKKMIVMASDVGNTFHVTVSEITEDSAVPVGYRRHTLWVGTTHSWQGLEDIHARYMPGITVVDAGPETTSARDFCDRIVDRNFGMQAYRCAFHQGDHVAGKELGLAKSKPLSSRLVTVDRTQAMDRAFYDIRDGYNVLPLDILTVPDWSTQMCMPVREVVGARAKWSKGEDHYRLSDTYARVAVQIAAQSGCEPSP